MSAQNFSNSPAFNQSLPSFASSNTDPANAGRSNPSGTPAYQPAPAERFDSSMYAVPLSEVVGVSQDGWLPNANDSRGYMAVVNTVAKMRNLMDGSNKRVRYYVGKRAVTTHVQQLTRAIVPVNAVQNSIKVSKIISSEMVKFEKKYTPFPSQWDTMDLAPMGNQLARALALYTINGQITCGNIRGGQPILIRSYNVIAESTGVTRGSVFIPRQASFGAGQAAFAALAAAANAFGSVVHTDSIEMNQNNAPVIAEVEGATLARGIVQALRILLSIYDACEQGAVMALAITKGVHEILSVRGHTDEGSIMRDVLRRCEYMAPFGGVYTELAKGYFGLPTGSEYNPRTFVAIVDAIALKSAALVALSDPLIFHEGKFFPTVMIDSDTAVSAAGTIVAGTDDGEQRMTRMLYQCSSEFCSIYAKNLSWLFMVQGGHDIAATVLSRQFASIAGQRTRHLRYTAAAPFFWIEPTSLFANTPGSVAEQKGYGVYAKIGETSQLPWFEEVNILGDKGTQILIGVKQRSARTSGLMLHLNQHHQDGLANFIPMQFSDDRMTFVGGVNDISTKKNGNESIANYTWGRGHSDLQAPAEILYTGKYIGFRVILTTIDPATSDFTISHTPSRDELLNGYVTVSVNKPEMFVVGNAAANARGIRRSRDRAAQALVQAKLATQMWFNNGGELWGPDNNEPTVVKMQGGHGGPQVSDNRFGVDLTIHAQQPGQLVPDPPARHQGPPAQMIYSDRTQSTLRQRPQLQAGVAVPGAPNVVVNVAGNPQQAGAAGGGAPVGVGPQPGAQQGPQAGAPAIV